MKLPGFKDRLLQIAAGRPLTPWLVEKVGWTNGDVGRVNGDHVPGPEKLKLLAERERVNLSWLLAELGQPFIEPTSRREVAEPPPAPYEPGVARLVMEAEGLEEKSLQAITEVARLLKKGTKIRGVSKG